jgi:hypothetical protein
LGLLSAGALMHFTRRALSQNIREYKKRTKIRESNH